MSQHKSTGIMDYVYLDIWGLSSTPSRGGALYMLTFIDDYSRKVMKDGVWTEVDWR